MSHLPCGLSHQRREAEACEPVTAVRRGGLNGYGCDDNDWINAQKLRWHTASQNWVVIIARL
eukprot:7386674-Pyramimonas_sp.AAC.1